MNKYKIISLVLALALLASLVRLVIVRKVPAAPVSAVAESEVVLRNIHARKSVRAFTTQDIRRGQIDTLLRAAMAAPSGRDMRPWQFVVVSRRAVLDSLADALPYAKMLRQAPVAIAVCGDMSITDAGGNPSGNWTFDCSAATQNLLLAAEALGLGAVWTGVHPYPDRVATVKAALGLPEHVTPLNLIPIGHPMGEARPKEKYDSTRIHHDTW